MPTRAHRAFRAAWWSCNTLLAAVALTLVYASGWEFSTRRYLDGFSDAIVPTILPAEQKVNAILNWMRIEPSRASAADAGALARRDPETALTYRQLLDVCGTATNAFLNLARASGVPVRRLLLLTPNHTTKHVVAEALIGGQWKVVDPTYRVILKDARGRYLTHKDLQNPAVFEEAASLIPDYPREYNFEHFTHVRLERLPLKGLHLRLVLDTIYPGWDEALDWSLFLERESFFYLVCAATGTVFLLFLRTLLAWYADKRLRAPRFQLRVHMARAGAALFSAPEIKE